MKVAKYRFIFLLLSFNFSSVSAQHLYKEVLSAAYSSNTQQTIGLPLSTIASKKSLHFYGFEEPFRKVTFPSIAPLLLTIYPNPFVELFTIECSKEIDSYELKLFALDGSPLKAAVIPSKNQLVVSVQTTYTGLILASITLNGVHYLKKVIKK